MEILNKVVKLELDIKGWVEFQHRKRKRKKENHAQRRKHKKIPEFHSPRSIYKVCPEGVQPYNMENRDIYWRRYKIQETLYTGQWCLSSLQSRHLGTSHSSPKCHQLFCHIFLNLINDLKSLLFKGESWEKPEVARSQIWAVGGWVTWVIWYFAKNLCTRHDTWAAHCCDEAANHQLPIAVAFSIIQIVSTEECSSFMQNADSLLY